MTCFSVAGPGEGVNKPEKVIYDKHEQFDRLVIFIGWQGNGYQQDTCWIQIDEMAACDLTAWQ